MLDQKFILFLHKNANRCFISFLSGEKRNFKKSSLPINPTTPMSSVDMHFSKRFPNLFMQDNQIYDYLLSHGVKGSVQRVAVMKYLLEHHTHPSVDEIYNDLVRKLPTLSKTTIYNTLKLFVDQGVVRMLTIDGKNANFDGDTSEHAHFFCFGCEKIYDIPQSKTNCKQEISLPGGFKAEQTELYYKGYCPACLTKRDC